MILVSHSLCGEESFGFENQGHVAFLIVSLCPCHELCTFMTGLPWRLKQCRICLRCRRPGFNPWVRKIPWRREWQPTPVFLPGKYHGQRSLVGYSLWGHKESDTTKPLTLSLCDSLGVIMCPEDRAQPTDVCGVKLGSWSHFFLPSELTGCRRWKQGVSGLRDLF